MASSQTAQIAQTTQTQVVGGIEQEQLNHFLGPVQGANKQEEPVPKL